MGPRSCSLFLLEKSPMSSVGFAAAAVVVAKIY